MNLKSSILSVVPSSLTKKAAALPARSNFGKKTFAPSPITDTEQAQLLDYARKGNDEAQRVPSIAAARALDVDPMYLFGFDVAVGLCKGMWLPGPGQDRFRTILDGSVEFALPNGSRGRGNAMSVKGFNVGQALQHGISKAQNDLATQAAASAGADQAAGAYIAAGLAGSGLDSDVKANTMSAVVGNPAATSGALQVATKKTGIITRILAWFGLK
jgi:hypothetical protein